MMNIVYLLLMYASAQATWVPVSYEKVILPKHSPEAVIFTKNESLGNSAFTVSYQIGGQIVATRAIPTELMTQMKERLRQDVLTLVKVDTSGLCASSFIMEEGSVEMSGGKPSLKPKKRTTVCLSATKQKRTAEDAFARWYASARALFDF